MEDDYPEEADDRLVCEEYKIWKRHTPFLYDLVVTHALEFPSLTVSWLPEREYDDDGFVRQKFLLGTHARDNQQNYLTIAEARLPTEHSKPKQEDESQHNSSDAFITITQQINHEGEVNKARAMPHNSFVIATKSSSPDVFIFDYSRHPSKPKQGAQCRPDIRLTGHDQEGYGLAWNPWIEGLLLSGSDDKTVCMWDINATANADDEVAPLRIFRGHTSSVEDVAWHANGNMFASCGDDRRLVIWDRREGDAAAVARRQPVPQATTTPHTAEINCLSFNPKHEHLIATGSADKMVMVHDLRNLTRPLHTLAAHTEDVYQIAWNPFNMSVLATGSADRRVLVWDLSRIGASQTREEAEDGPPELLFAHGGHTHKVSDLSWNMEAEWMMASVAEDNIVQVWQMADAIHAEPDTDR